VVGAQNHLGEMQDRVMVVRLLSTQKPRSPALKLLADVLSSEIDQLQHEFAPRWERLCGRAFREELAAGIADL